MIIVRLSGGLGNQMFQYAIGRHLAEKQYAILKLDLSLFEKYKVRPYDLHCFKIWENIATQTEIESLQGKPPSQLDYLTERVLQKIGISRAAKPKSRSPFLLREKDLSFDPSVLQKSGHLYLEGYWQSEKYFSPITEIIRREFEVKYNQDAESHRIADFIHSSDSISLHVRRTDYVQNPLSAKIHGSCDLAYYARAIQHVAEAAQNPHFFIFSDDLAWVKSELKLDFPVTYVEHNGPIRSYEDMRLMSLCKHNIIANSSFSWWGAWLNENPHKVVVAPNRWFADEAKNSQAKELVPETWVRM